MAPERLISSIELIAASAWGTEGALRSAERGDLDEAGTLLDGARRPLLQGLRELEGALAALLGVADEGDPDPVGREALDGIERLRHMVAARIRS